MRTQNSIKNIASSVGLTLLMTLLGFFTRKFFVDSIGVEYLGLNGLLTNILGVISLIEGGFGGSIVYNLYKPLAEGDRKRIIALFQLYRRIYRFVAIGFFALSLCIYPFLHKFIKEGDNLSYVSLVFFIFVFNSLVQYVSASRWSIINADQKAYKLTALNYVYQIGLNIVKILILVYTQNYILYLVIESIFGLFLAMGIIHKVNRLYPYLNTQTPYSVEPATRKNILTNVKALFLHSLGGYFCHSTDNIIISSFISISMVGLYSNYALILGMFNSFITQIINGFSESIANLIAVESCEKSYKIFRLFFFLNFLIVSIPCIILIFTIHPFIICWLGAEYQLDSMVTSVLIINFYVFGMRQSAFIFKVKSGIFTQDRFSPIIQGIINLFFSLLFVRFWGLAGVFFGTTVSVFSVGFWQFPRLVYKYKFQKPLSEYFKIYFGYTLLMLGAILLNYLVLQFIDGNQTWALLFIRGGSSFLLTVTFYYIFFRKTTQYEEFKEYLVLILHKNPIAKEV